MSVGIALWMMGCMHHVELEVTKPADVTIPGDLKRLAVFNRGTTQSSDAVMSVFLTEHTKLKQPRFDIREPSAADSAYQKMNIALGQDLESRVIVSLCQSLEVDALVALEGADVNGEWDITTFTETETTTETVTKDGKTETQEVSREVTRYRARYAIDARADWVFYTCKGTILDKKTVRIQDRWSGEGDSRIEAKADAGDTDSIKEDIHHILGRSYVQRISPYEVDVVRSLYRGRPLKSGNIAFDANQFEAAQQAFQKAAKSSTGVPKGKALHNLAIAEEAAGDIQAAFEHAQRAARLTDKNQSKTLKRTLRKRLSEQVDIETQLGEDSNVPDVNTEGADKKASEPEKK